MTDIEEALLRLTEWHLATLERALMVKRTPKSELQRHMYMAYEALTFCRHFISEERLKTAPQRVRATRARQWLKEGLPAHLDAFKAIVNKHGASPPESV